MRRDQETEAYFRDPLTVVMDIGFTVIVLAAVSAACILIQDLVKEHGEAFVPMLFILGVFLIARMTHGYLYGIAASLIGTLIVNYLFSYPFYAFNFFLPGYPLTVLALLTVSVLTSALTTRLKDVDKVRSLAKEEQIRSSLLRAVSHDLRTPLTAILGANSVLAEQGDRLSPEERQALHGQIAEEAEWMARVVENLLTITRIRQNQGSRIQKTPELPEEVLAEAVEKIRKRYPDARMEVTAPAEPILCPMDATLIEQVLINLVENAVVHAEGATRIRLKAESNAAYVIFSVEDDGCGLSPERRADLFEEGTLSVREGDRKRGMGIGLSVCSTIVQAHGGDMRAEAGEGGKGLKVLFRIPRKAG